MIEDFVIKNRSYRRFNAEKEIKKEQLISLVELARNCPSAANLQVLKYFISYQEATNKVIFSHLRFAGYLHDWNGPEESEQPTGYIIVLTKETSSDNTFIDVGIAAQTMLLGAVEQGLGGCMVASINKDQLIRDIGIDQTYQVLLVIALGYPTEKVELTGIKNPNDVRYWRDEKQVHYVPKRDISDLIIE